MNINKKICTVFLLILILITGCAVKTMKSTGQLNGIDVKEMSFSFDSKIPENVTLKRVGLGYGSIVSENERLKILVSSQLLFQVLAKGFNEKFPDLLIKNGILVKNEKNVKYKFKIYSYYIEMMCTSGSCVNDIYIRGELFDDANKVIWSFYSTIGQTQLNMNIDEDMYKIISDELITKMTNDGIIKR